MNPADHERENGHQQESRNAHPEDHKSGLQGIIIGNYREKLRDHVGRAIHDHAKRQCHHHDAGKLPAEHQAQFEHGFARVKLSVGQKCKTHDRHQCELDDQRGIEPLLTVAFFQNDGQPTQPKDHTSYSRPISLAQVNPVGLFMG